MKSNFSTYSIYFCMSEYEMILNVIEKNHFDPVSVSKNHMVFHIITLKNDKYI